MWQHNTKSVRNLGLEYSNCINAGTLAKLAYNVVGPHWVSEVNGKKIYSCKMSKTVMIAFVS